jgi:hypothetical protein
MSNDFSNGGLKTTQVLGGEKDQFGDASKSLIPILDL